jgi:hypothetical protein
MLVTVLTISSGADEGNQPDCGSLGQLTQSQEAGEINVT